MADGKEARSLTDFLKLKMGIVSHQTFGIAYAHIGNPIPVAHPVHTVDVLRQVGTVGTQGLGKFVQGNTWFAIAVGIYPILNPAPYLGMICRCLPCPVGSNVSVFQQGIFHLLIEENIVLIAAVKINVERDG